ncbi:MAG TPA: Vms1/Ankzf1 family peptidyl-tRNA hydrolase [Thermoleophilaceae bacterium]
MQVSAPDRDQLRALAELRLDRPVVLSLYLNLDPSQFATPPARKSGVRSLIDEAERRVRERNGLSDDDKSSLHGSLERAKAFLENDLPTDGAHALAVFASEGNGLFEALKLPRSVPNRVAIGHSPLVGPLARIARRERWCVTLVNRRDARILRGGADGLREVERIHDDVSGQHDQGGWSQSRYQRGVEKEKDDHLKTTCDALLRHFKRQPFQRLIVGGPREVVTDFEQKLHHYLSERLAGRVEVDVERSNPDQVLEAARPLIEKLEREREHEALERLGERGACGIEDVLQPLNERRVELLILDEQFGGVTGVQCLECGWLGLEGDRCPADGSETVQLEDLTEAMIELSVQQAADLLAVHHEREALERYGGAAALLRF